VLPQQKESDQLHDLHLYTNETPRTFHTTPDLQATADLGPDLGQLEHSLPDIISNNRSGTEIINTQCNTISK